MTNFYSGVAGARGCNPKGIIIHNDAGSQQATAAYYRNWLPTHPAETGFAHYYVASDGIFQAEKDSNVAWHCGNSKYNHDFIGIEACQSMGDVNVFKKNEANALKLAAQLCKKYNITPNRTTIMLHKEVFSTACPHRSWELHGKSVNAVKNYFIAEIKRYMGGTNTNGGINIKVGKDDLMFIYEKQLKNKKVEVWFVMNDTRMWLPSNTYVTEAQNLIKRYGGSTTRQRYNYDNFGLKMIEKSTKEVKL